MVLFSGMLLISDNTNPPNVSHSSAGNETPKAAAQPVLDFASAPERYVSLLLGRTMREAGVRPSMGSISSPWDNAAMESLMGLIKAECVHARTFETREQAALEIFDYIECFYNRVRIHSALGNLSPEEFEARHTEDAAPRAA